MPDSPDRFVRVASGQGFWGDWQEAPKLQVRRGPIDYLMLDYLAEITMSILEKQRERDPAAGYARDFVDMVLDLAPDLVSKGIRVVSNAGGVNPDACRDALVRRLVDVETVRPLRIATVRGDDLMSRLDEVLAAGHELRNMETGEPLSTVRDRVTAANAYMGAGPILQALRQGADVVVTGRSTDTALTYGPLIHEFGWEADDWNRIAAGVVAGHINECGAQACGGNTLFRWREVDLVEPGYPIIEASADGSFVVTKHPSLGGRVNWASVTEQLVYEMGDPTEYITPDCVADFSTIQLEDLGDDRVRVTGVEGRPRPELLKVSIAYRGGSRRPGRSLTPIPTPTRRRSPRTGCCAVVWIIWAWSSTRSERSTSAPVRATARSPAPPTRRCQRWSCVSAFEETTRCAWSASRASLRPSFSPDRPP